MAEATQDNLDEQVRFAKIRAWAADPVKTRLLPYMVPILNRMDISEVQKQLASLELQVRDEQQKLDKLEPETVNQRLSELKQLLKNRNEEGTAILLRVNALETRCKESEMKTNTFQNGHNGFQSKIDSRITAIRKDLETVDARIPVEAVEFYTLMRDNKEKFIKLMETINIPEKLQFLQRSTDEHPELMDREQPQSLAPPPVSPLTTLGNTPAAVANKPYPRAIHKLTQLWNHWESVYEKKKPRHEYSFIWSFIKAHEPIVAGYLQKAIIEFCPQTAQRSSQPDSRGRYVVGHTLDLRKITWPEACKAFDQMDLEPLIKLLENRHTRRAGSVHVSYGRNSSMLTNPLVWASNDEL
ncbi:hypothetical protein BJ170DRAFT_677393 [Xylariales sp. AK1849]|nr:hypothetical protein BJ170DRAFT_677393 [Xylariales sp. AK1849]